MHRFFSSSKRIQFVIALYVIALLVSACSGRRAEPTATPEPTTLKFITLTQSPVEKLLAERYTECGGYVVFSCGGIGATPDDHTRQCAAAALGVPLVLHAGARDLILARMRDVAGEQGVPFDPDSPHTPPMEQGLAKPYLLYLP